MQLGFGSHGDATHIGPSSKSVMRMNVDVGVAFIGTSAATLSSIMESMSCVEKDSKNQLCVYLTAKQIKLVQDTWHEINNDIPTLGVTIFVNFFEMEPDLKSLFPKIVRMNDSSQLEWYMDKEMLQKHAVTVLEALGAAVESLEDSDFLNSVLISVGQTHFKRSIKPHMLKRLWPSLNYGLSVALGDRYTKEAEDAWKRLYTYICVQMKLGMEHPEMDLGDEFSIS
ncbi:neuroglobin-like [Gigantopelta aegis]|uniref:neuroglobin-like n=1 Tax=Gigantopelta aegis TaxID=1735272 RepID=UPI001B88B012|nr:neuroglobin-like [Gigantopelta aegis]